MPDLTHNTLCYLLLLLFLVHQALQHHHMKVSTFSNTSFHLTRTWMHFVQLFIFIILISSFIPFSHLILVSLPILYLSVSTHLSSILLFVFRCTWPASLIFRPYCNLNMFLFLMRSFNSSFIVFRDVPSLSFVGPHILLISLFRLLIVFFS